MSTNKNPQPKPTKSAEPTPRVLSSRTLAAAKVLRAILFFPTAISVLYACYYAYTLLAMPISGRVAAFGYLAIILPTGAFATAIFIVFSAVNLKKHSLDLQKYATHILICALLMIMWPILVFIASRFILFFRHLPLL